MADHTANAMLAAIRSMRDVVIPALDPAHPLAREQAGLIVKYLEFWSQRIDHVADRNRAELSAYVAMGRMLLGPASRLSPGLEAELETVLEHSQTLLSARGNDAAAFRDGVSTLTQLVSALVRAADTGDHPAAEDIRRVVVEHSEPIALLQRSWFGPQGWEDPLPPALEQVLAEQLTEGNPS